MSDMKGKKLVVLEYVKQSWKSHNNCNLISQN